MANTFIHPLAIVEPGASLGDNTKVWHYAHIRGNAKIGDNCVIAKGVFVDQGVHIGSNVKIQNNASLYHGLTISDGVFIGPHVCFTNDLYPRAVNPDLSPKSSSDWTVSKTFLDVGASIGANATIVAGVSIGRWALVAAGSVVTKSLPPFAIARGNPARIVGVVNPSGEVVSRSYKPGTYPSSHGGSEVVIDPEWCL